MVAKAIQASRGGFFLLLTIVFSLPLQRARRLGQDESAFALGGLLKVSAETLCKLSLLFRH